MRAAQAIGDTTAIALSLACTIHCLAWPFLLLLLPSMAALQLDNEAFHSWMLVAVVPCSLVALAIGCKQYKRFRLMLVVALGLLCLLLPLLLGEQRVSATGEKILTVIGASIVALGHWLNYRLCHTQQHATCNCPNTPDTPA